MKVLYLDLPMGAAGDMLTAALFELFDEKEKVLNELNSLGIPGVEFIAEESVKCGIRGTHISVRIHGAEEHVHHLDHHGHHNEEHRHHGGTPAQIRDVIDTLNATDKVKENAKAVYDIIAAAEAEVHGKSVDNIHFHEVGALDAVADVTAVCYLMSKLAFDCVEASPVNVGSGTVICAHGELPVPAPATAVILNGIPSYGSDIKGELCTPTGAALLRHFAGRFGPLTPMEINKTGYGMGRKDFANANCVRAFSGERAQLCDVVYNLACNIDDMTGEELGYAAEKIRECGALDVTLTPTQTKKGRPGIILSVLTSASNKDKCVECIFRFTSTIGLREEICSRSILRRIVTEKDGVPVKISDGFGVSKEKAEFDFTHCSDVN